ncbi:carbohydrate kinase [Thiomicrorhabdus sp. ZW0627]|uniref:carbohydrate kinase family protein n=1 Tax=Thiomicrorhabdus sp. ZW0627 TaxID=3039774 RepID=UPI002436A847|nr:carbohydrate kinase [Thiomicrorhabdus sp. ZW0627]MDG6773977.1 carbohydrate kinase [Thiomicrorhabdus sp. ZW0627]
MSEKPEILVFGEVLFDCFQNGERVLGGAPFNVAWHLQALGDNPKLISRIGDDELGRMILMAMRRWEMDVTHVQVDPKHPTGKVEVTMIHNEPNYRITPNCAYDFISAERMFSLPRRGILYHGTLGLRNEVSRKAFSHLLQCCPELSVFLDVNLRSPWWKKEEVYHWLEKARWVKLNEHEIQQLELGHDDTEEAMEKLKMQFGLEQVILTLGEKGAMVLGHDGEFHYVVPTKADHFVDAVGAGDAFTAVYIHGLLSGWGISESLQSAQKFASQVIGLRGATTNDSDFYREFIKNELHGFRIVE